MKVNNLEFTEFINSPRIMHRVDEMAKQITHDYRDRAPVFLPVLNGSFIFAADLVKQVEMQCRISFVKVSSYSGMNSSGQLKSLIGLEESLFNQDMIIVEDIVDTGFTLQKIVGELKTLGVKSIEVAALLRKRQARDKGLQVKYVGFEIDEEFVLGYGLDYDGLGRNLKDIYKAKRQLASRPD